MREDHNLPKQCQRQCHCNWVQVSGNGLIQSDSGYHLVNIIFIIRFP